MNVLQFPSNRGQLAALRECAMVYRNAKATGLWDRQKSFRELWYFLLECRIKEANDPNGPLHFSGVIADNLEGRALDFKRRNK